MDGHIRSDLIGAAYGLACFPVVLFASPPGFLHQNAGVFFCLLLVVMSTLAGIFALSFARASLPPGKSAPLSARIGARTGAIAVLLGSGAIVTALTLHSLGVCTRPGFPTPPYFGLLVSALSAVPAIAGASAVPLLSDPRRHFPKPLTPTKPPADPQDRQASTRRSALPYILLFSGLCYLTPLLVPILSKEEPAPEPTVESSPSSEPSPVPDPFQYELPEGFTQADPSRLQVVAQKQLDGAIPNLAIALSPNDELIFYCVRDRRQSFMIVKRLDGFENVAVPELIIRRH